MPHVWALLVVHLAALHFLAPPCEGLVLKERRAAMVPAAGSWGFDLQGMDESVKPGDNFFRYASGKYIENISIPADKTSWGPFDVLAEESQKKVRDILEADAKKGGRLGHFYNSFMNEARVESLDLKPLSSNLEEVRNLQTHTEFARMAGKENDDFYPSTFSLWVDADSKNPERNSVSLQQSGLGLPDRDYYLKDSFKDMKEKYGAFVGDMLRMIGWPEPTSAAAEVLKFEEELAKVHMPRAEMRDPIKMYNPMTVEELQSKAEGFDWQIYLDQLGPFPADTKIVVGPVNAIINTSRLIKRTDMTVLRSWAAFHTVSSCAAYLPKRFVEANFNFYGKTMSGQEKQSDRWKRGVSIVNSNMGDTVGKEYVKLHFPPSSKKQVEELTLNLKNAFEVRLKQLDWMAPSTKAEALKKLRSFDIQVGYPKKIQEFDFAVDEGDLLGNIARAGAAEWKFWKAQLDKPVDRDFWAMTPQTVNAYNMPNFNMVVFPAAILQPPFFDPNADSAVNYGSIGAVIGHEMTHGFDDQGRQYDAIGQLKNWWTDADEKEFLARANKYGNQFAEFTLDLPEGAHIDPALTMGENIADLGGLTLALDAYLASVGKQGGAALKPPAVMPEQADGLEGVRRVFLGYAQVWREKSRDDAIKEQLVTDPHPPAISRVAMPTRNIDSWYDAFGVSSDSALYLPEDKRVKIW